MTKILVPRYQPVFHLAGGPGAIWHPGTFVFLSGGPFGVPKLKLVNLTSIPALLLEFCWGRNEREKYRSYNLVFSVTFDVN